MRHHQYVQSTEHAATATPRVVAWTPEQFALRVNEAMNIYVRAMNYPQHAAGQRAVTARRHATHPGFACRAALLDDETLVAHELCHVWQMQHHPVRMPLSYLLVGYARNPYEREAGRV